MAFVAPASAQAGGAPPANGTNATSGGNNTSASPPRGQLDRLNRSNTTNGTTGTDALNTGSGGTDALNTGSGGGGDGTDADNGGGGGGTDADNGGDSGGGCGITNPGACIPSPAELLKGFMNFIGNSIANHLKPVINAFTDIIVGIPAPGEPLDPTTWVTPEDGMWPGIYRAYYIFTALAMAALLPAFMIALDTADAYRREQRLKRLSIHAAMILGGALFVMPVSLHFFDVLATSLAPSGSEFFSTPGNFAKLGIGVILGVGAIVTQSSLVLAGIAVLLMIYVAIHILAAFWPIFWVSRLAPVSSIKWVGNAGIASFYGLCFLRVLQSAMLRLLFELSWDPVKAGAAAALASIIMTIIGLFFIFIFFPKAFVKKGIPASAMLSGGRKR